MPYKQNRKAKGYIHFQGWLHPENDKEEIALIKKYKREHPEINDRDVMVAGIRAIEETYYGVVAPRPDDVQAMFRDILNQLKKNESALQKIMSMDFDRIRSGDVDYIDQVERDVHEIEHDLHESITNRYHEVRFDHEFDDDDDDDWS